MNQDVLQGLVSHDPAQMLLNRNPYLRVGAVGLPKGRVTRRQAATLLTPGGRPMQPEVMGVDTDVKTPNADQPMSGEYHLAGLAGSAEPTFHNPAMPRSNGTASHEMLPQPRQPGSDEPIQQRLRGMLAARTMVPTGPPAGLPIGSSQAMPVNRAALAPLPHLAGGGFVPSGGAAVVGDATGDPRAEEVVQPGPGGVRVTPVVPPPPTRDLTGFGGDVNALLAGLLGRQQQPVAPVSRQSGPDLTGFSGDQNALRAGMMGTRQQPAAQQPAAAAVGSTGGRDLTGFGPKSAAPSLAGNFLPPALAGPMSDVELLRQNVGLTEPGGRLNPANAPKRSDYKVHGLRRVLGDVAGVAAGILTGNPMAGVGAHDMISIPQFRRDENAFAAERQQVEQDRPALARAAELEQQASNADQKVASAQDKHTIAMQTLDANLRNKGLMRDPNNPGNIVPLPADQLTAQQQQKLAVEHSLQQLHEQQVKTQQAQADLEAARADLARAGNDPNSPEYKLKQKALDIAKNRVSSEEARSNLMGQLAQVRLLGLGYTHDPRILDTPVAGQFGIQGPPPGQPNDEYGRAIGTSSPQSPTRGLRESGQRSMDFLQDLPNIRNDVANLAAAGELGPIAGRMNAEAYKLGLKVPQAYSDFRARVDLLMSGATKIHLNTQGGLEHLQKMINDGAPPEQINTSLQALEDMLRRYKETGGGNQHAGKPAPAAHAGAQDHEVTIQTPDGRRLIIPRTNLDQARKMGAKEIQ